MRLYKDQPIGTVPRARDLRHNASAPERRLLRGLRDAFPDLKWRHQTPLGPYFIDIMCFSERLAIEVDGDTHVAAEDARRDDFVAREGFQTFRFSNLDVMENLDGVLGVIADIAGNVIRTKVKGNAR